MREKSAATMCFLGLLLGFLHAGLFREMSLRIPLNFFFPHLLILAFTGMAAGLLYGKRPYAFVKRHPLALLAYLAVFLMGIGIYRGDSIFFWTLTLYYPMPIPEYGWVKAIFYLVGLVLLPGIFFLLACLFSEAWESSKNPRFSLFLFLIGAAAGTLLAYPAQFLGAYTILLIASLALLFFLPYRPWVWAAGLGIAAGVLLYGAYKQNYPILLSLKGHTLLDSRITDHYKADFYTFRDGTCMAQAVNDFIHVYACRDHEELSLELAYLNRVLAEGLEDYRVLIVGSAAAVYPHHLLHANPQMETCVVVEVDRQMIQGVLHAQEAVGQNIYQDSRFVLRASEPRHYLDKETERYDILYLHRIGNALIYYPYTLVPVEYYLLTEESLKRIFDRLLVEDGVYVMDWGIPDEWEVQQFVASFPKDVSVRAFWTTLARNPVSGAPILVVLASRSPDRLDRVADRLLQATYFTEVKEPKGSDFFRITDDRPWLKFEVVVALTVLIVPLLVAPIILLWKTRRLHLLPRWKPGGPGRRYYLLFGILFVFLNAFALGRVTRLSPVGITPGWLLVEAALLLGLAAGILGSRLTDRFRAHRKPLFALLAVLCGLSTYLLDTLQGFHAALVVLALQGFLLGQVFGYGLRGIAPSERSALCGFERVGAALGIGLFQITVLFLGFRMTGLVAAALVLVAGWWAARDGEAGAAREA